MRLWSLLVLHGVTLVWTVRLVGTTNLLNLLLLNLLKIRTQFAGALLNLPQIWSNLPNIANLHKFGLLGGHKYLADTYIYPRARSLGGAAALQLVDHVAEDRVRARRPFLRSRSRIVGIPTKLKGEAAVDIYIW